MLRGAGNDSHGYGPEHAASSPVVPSPGSLAGHSKRSGAAGQPSVPLWIFAQMFGVGSFTHVVRDSLSVMSVAAEASHVSVPTYCACATDAIPDTVGSVGGYSSARATYVSWDLVIVKLPAGATGLDELPSDWMPPSLGRATDVARRILEVAPDADVDASGGRIDRDGFGIAVDLQLLGTASEGEVDTISLEVRGESDDVAVLLQQLGERLGAAVVDGTNCQALRFDGDAERSFQAWRQFRDRVFEKINAERRVGPAERAGRLRSALGKEMRKLLTIGRKLPGITEGVAQECTPLEQRRLRVRKQGFLLLETDEALLRLGPSLAQAHALAAGTEAVKVGEEGWVTLAPLDGPLPPARVLRAWIAESHALARSRRPQGASSP